MAAAALNTQLDSKIAAKITDLDHDKALAVEREDYDEAKQIKQAVEHLKAFGEKVAQLEERKRAAVDKEDYDLAKALKGAIQNMHSVIDAANPLAPLTTIRLCEILDEPPAGRALPSGETLPVSEHCRASVQGLNSSGARKEPAILPSSQGQSGASADGLIGSGLDRPLAPPPPSSTPNAASTGPLCSTKRKASHAFPVAWPPGIKRGCTEKQDQKDGSGGNSNVKFTRRPGAHVGFHGSLPAVGGSTEHDWNLGATARSSVVNARTPVHGSPYVGRLVPTADPPTRPSLLNTGEVLGAQQEGNADNNAQRAPLAPPSCDVSQQEAGSSSSADSTMMDGAASSSCCPSSWCPSSSKDVSSDEEDESTFKPAPLSRGHFSKRGRNGQARDGRQTLAVKRKAGARGAGHRLPRKVPRRSKGQKVAHKTRTGRSGFRGVYIWPNGKYRAEITIKGKKKHLGTFVDLESAVRAYDAAAIAEHGPDAILNFPLDCNLSRRHNQSHVVTAGGRCGQAQAATNGSLPAGNAGSNQRPVRTALRSKGHGPGGNVELEHIQINMPAGRVESLARLLDTEKRAWFSLREASNKLDKHASDRDRLLQQCRRLGVLIRPATAQETDLIREAKVVHVSQNRPRLVTPAGLRKAVESLKFPLHTLDSICKEATQVAGDRVVTGTMRLLLFLRSCLWAAMLSFFIPCKHRARPNLAEGVVPCLILHAGAVACAAARVVSKLGVARCLGPQLVCGLFFIGVVCRELLTLQGSA